MLKRGFKDNDHNITEQQFQYFAERSEGYSGSDIANLVKDAVYQPVRKLQVAKKFKKSNGKLTPVEDNAYGPDIVETTLVNIPPSQLGIPIITANDLQIAVSNTKASVDKTQLKEYEQFTANFGQEG